MPDDKKMYLSLFQATEKAIDVLKAAQQECEELYISAPEPRIALIEELISSDTASDTAR